MQQLMIFGSLHEKVRCVVLKFTFFFICIQITFIVEYFWCRAVTHPEVLLFDTEDSCWMWASLKWAKYSVNGIRGNPRSFCMVTHNSWCHVEFGQVPIWGREDISHTLLLLWFWFFPCTVYSCVLFITLWVCIKTEMMSRNITKTKLWL